LLGTFIQRPGFSALDSLPLQESDLLGLNAVARNSPRRLTMKTTQWTRTITMSALALALCLGATTLSAQPDQRGQRGGPRDNPGAAAPVRPGPGAAPAERGPGGERGPMDRRLQREFAPPQASPVAGLLADVNPFWDRPQVVERMALTEEQVAALKTSYEKQIGRATCRERREDARMTLQFWND